MKHFAIAGTISFALISAALAQSPAPPAPDGAAMAHDVASQWTALTIVEGNFTKSMSTLLQDYQRVIEENAKLKAELEKLKSPPSPPPAAQH